MYIYSTEVQIPLRTNSKHALYPSIPLGRVSLEWCLGSDDDSHKLIVESYELKNNILVSGME